MKRSHLGKQISVFIDGETEPKETKEIKTHLQECAQCKQVYHSFKEIRKASLDLKSFSTSPYFAQKVMANYQARKKESFWNSFDFLPRPIVHGALIVSIIIVTILSWPQKQTIQVVEELSETSDYTVIFENGTNETLATNDQALQFALNDGLEVFEGEPR